VIEEWEEQATNTRTPNPTERPFTKPLSQGGVQPDHHGLRATEAPSLART
jgi:hypothetical protein